MSMKAQNLDYTIRLAQVALNHRLQVWDLT